MNKIPPLNGLRAFDVAGRHLNFRAAADELGLTQGAVAQQVRSLEAHLGLPLFDRLPKGLAFTAPGRSYHARISTAFEELRAATDNLRPEPDKVVISVTPTFAAKWLIPNLPEFSSAQPEIDLQILATEKVSSFYSDTIDLAIRQGQPPFGATLSAVRLFNQQIIAVTSPAVVAEYELPLSPTVLSHLPKLHDAHDLWPQFLKLLNVEDKAGRGLRLSQTTLALDAALSGQGVALVSRFLVTRDLAANNLVQVSLEVLQSKQDFYLLSKRSSSHGTATKAVIDWLVSHGERD